MSTDESHDFEFVASPNTSTTLSENPTPTPTPTPTNDKSIRDLFSQPTPPLFIQTLAKVAIFASTPYQIFWSAVTAIFVAVCQPTPNDETPLDQVVLRQITLHTTHRLDQCQKRLEWVEREMPAVVKRCNDHIAKTIQQVQTAKDAAIGQASPVLPRMILFAIAVPFVFSRGGWFKAPIWIWLGLGYWVGKRRGRGMGMGRGFGSRFGTGPEVAFMRS